MEVEEKFLCPLTKKIMLEPVVDALGNTYDKEAIQEYLEHNDTVPNSKPPEKLPHKKLTPNKVIQVELVEYKEDKIKKGLATFPKLLKQKEHFPLAEKLLNRIDQYNKSLDNSFSE